MEIALATPDKVGRIEKRILSLLAEQAEDWADCLNALSKWEDENLLDNPTPQLLDQHRQTLEHLIKVGRILKFATEHPDYPDRETAGMVAATLRVLQDIFNSWHVRPRMGKEESDRI